ncbi:GDP-mannose 4,6-dehydratase [Ulvibacter litoralis]|uniref:dTDP-glucose 4,6-dehydratase n=1 Tax=Ulvibacter litoralis TaxID=227084 RepID=A0A1G7DBH8_9FLAO|nr:GDP-mannose 4,6-dehydratase [Ulvibacter litoralis]GHC44429.1 hypothetical protein GCM10008083_03700 [Ulvibacter litoralis]SDE48095.1 dTDP-glucose 4,6-dehydratase [Ulvibacter litoralis]
MKNNKVLITGGAGFIGSNYVQYILETSQDEIFVLDKLTYAGDLKNLASISSLPNYTFIEKNACDKFLIYKV